MKITQDRIDLMNSWADDWALDQNAREAITTQMSLLAEPEGPHLSEIIRREVRRVGRRVNNRKPLHERPMDGDLYHKLQMRHGISPHPDTQRFRQELWYLQREQSESEIG